MPSSMAGGEMGVVVVVVSNWNRISLVELLFYRRRQQLEKRTKRRQSDSRGEKSTSSSSSSSTSSSQTGRWISFFSGESSLSSKYQIKLQIALPVCARRTRILKLWAIIETINTNHTITKEDCSNCNETFYRTRVCSSRLYILSKLYRHLDANRKSFHSTPDADMRPDQTQLSERPRRAVKVLPTSTFRDACEILLCFALKLGLR